MEIEIELELELELEKEKDKDNVSVTVSEETVCRAKNARRVMEVTVSQEMNRGRAELKSDALDALSKLA